MSEDLNNAIENEELNNDALEQSTENPDAIEQPETQEKQREDKIPLNKYLDEKKKRKELERQLREIEERNMSHENKQRVDKIKELVKGKGYDEGVAELMSDMFNEITKSLPKVDRVEQEILEDIQDYAEERPEILKHKKEIVEKIKKYRKADPDFSIDDALNLITPAKLRLSEIQTDVEQRQAIARRNVENKRVASSSSSESPKNPYPLDEADKKALEGLQKAQPDKSWTAEKFYKLMKT